MSVREISPGCFAWDTFRVDGKMVVLATDVAELVRRVEPLAKAAYAMLTSDAEKYVDQAWEANR